jgi:hypothetical protein
MTLFLAIVALLIGIVLGYILGECIRGWDQ